jgi:hypothetical protein
MKKNLFWDVRQCRLLTVTVVLKEWKVIFCAKQTNSSRWMKEETIQGLLDAGDDSNTILRNVDKYFPLNSA